MLKITKQDIHTIDFDDIHLLQDKQAEVKLEKMGVNRFESWLLPQLVANFGNWKLCTSNNKIDVLATLQHNCSDPKQQQLWKLTRINRSVLMLKQIKYPEYATLTPLIMLGFKRYQNVPYSHWQGLDNLSWILEPKLDSAVNYDCKDLFGLGSDRLLEIRQQGLTIRSGSKQGTLKPAETTWCLNNITDTELGQLPKLTQTILTQIWLAHPRYRSPSMILDIYNWDNIPAPLFPVDIFSPSKANDPEVEVKTTPTPLPWM